MRDRAGAHWATCCRTAADAVNDSFLAPDARNESFIAFEPGRRWTLELCTGLGGCGQLRGSARFARFLSGRGDTLDKGTPPREGGGPVRAGRLRRLASADAVHLIPAHSSAPAVRTSRMTHSGRQKLPMTHSRHRTRR